MGNMHQIWKDFLRSGKAKFGATVLVVCAIIGAVGQIKSWWTPDNSNVALEYIDRADVTVPIIASNTGTRPGIMSSGAVLDVMATDRDGKLQAYPFMLTASDASRKNLLIPEHTSKQYFFTMDFNQAVPNIFSKFAANTKSLLSIKKCIVFVTDTDFRGKERNTRFVIFDADTYGKLGPATTSDVVLKAMLGVEGCFIKIPQPIRQHYKILGRK